MFYQPFGRRWTKSNSALTEENKTGKKTTNTNNRITAGERNTHALHDFEHAHTVCITYVKHSPSPHPMHKSQHCTGLKKYILQEKKRINEIKKGSGDENVRVGGKLKEENAAIPFRLSRVVSVRRWAMGTSATVVARFLEAVSPGTRSPGIRDLKESGHLEIRLPCPGSSCRPHPKRH